MRAPDSIATAYRWWHAAALLALVCFLYREIASGLVRDWWNDPNFSHGFFVPLFSGFLVWRERKRLAVLPTAPSWWGALITAAALAVMIVGVLGSELFLQRTSLLVLLAGMVVHFLGWHFLRVLLFPWITLFLMVPLPTIIFNQIAFPLQILASKLASDLLPILGVPVLREGNVLMLPALPLEVAEACSGIRSLMSLVTLALIYSYFEETKTLGRALLVIAAVPISILANALRIIGTGLLVQYWDPERALGFFHEFSGWVIFMSSLGLLVAVHRLTRLLVRAPVGS